MEALLLLISIGIIVDIRRSNKREVIKKLYERETIVNVTTYQNNHISEEDMKI